MIINVDHEEQAVVLPAKFADQPTGDQATGLSFCFLSRKKTKKRKEGEKEERRESENEKGEAKEGN